MPGRARSRRPPGRDQACRIAGGCRPAWTYCRVTWRHGQPAPCQARRRARRRNRYGVAAHYGNPYAEQRALAQSAGQVDRSNRGIVRITGEDRLSWLHSLTTQDIEHLAPGETAQTLVLSPQGHIEHHLTLADDGTALWAHVEPGTAEALLAFLQSMRFLLRVDPADVTGDFAVLTLKGPAMAAGPPEGAVVSMADAFGIDVIVARDRLPGVSADLEQSGVRLARLAAYEALRIAAHRPRLGFDTDHDPAARGGLDRYRGPPQQGLLPGPGDRGAGTQRRAPSAQAGLPPPRRQRGPVARAR